MGDSPASLLSSVFCGSSPSETTLQSTRSALGSQAASCGSRPCACCSCTMCSSSVCSSATVDHGTSFCSSASCSRSITTRRRPAAARAAVSSKRCCASRCTRRSTSLMHWAAWSASLARKHTTSFTSNTTASCASARCSAPPSRRPWNLARSRSSASLASRCSSSACEELSCAGLSCEVSCPPASSASPSGGKALVRSDRGRNGASNRSPPSSAGGSSSAGAAGSSGAAGAGSGASASSGCCSTYSVARLMLFRQRASAMRAAFGAKPISTSWFTRSSSAVSCCGAPPRRIPPSGERPVPVSEASADERLELDSGPEEPAVRRFGGTSLSASRITRSDWITLRATAAGIVGSHGSSQRRRSSASALRRTCTRNACGANGGALRSLSLDSRCDVCGDSSSGRDWTRRCSIATPAWIPPNACARWLARCPPSDARAAFCTLSASSRWQNWVSSCVNASIPPSLSQVATTSVCTWSDAGERSSNRRPLTTCSMNVASARLLPSFGVLRSVRCCLSTAPRSSAVRIASRRYTGSRFRRGSSSCTVSSKKALSDTGICAAR